MEQKELMQQLASVQKNMEAMQAELNEMKNKAQRGEDYRQITNAMMGHVYSYYAHREREDLERFWVQSRDDISYSHNTKGDVTRAGVWNYYINGTDQRKARFAEIRKRVYNLDTPEGAAPGYRVIHILGSPYVEIAGDRKTAQGVWMSFSFMSSMNNEGKADTDFVLQRFGADFLNENGQWRIWHIRDYTDLTMDIPTHLKGPEVRRDEEGRPIETRGPEMHEGAGHGGPNGPRRSGGPGLGLSGPDRSRELTLESAWTYQPWTCTVMEPKLPMPYEHWDPKQSFITVASEDQDEFCAFIVE